MVGFDARIWQECSTKKFLIELPQASLRRFHVTYIYWAKTNSSAVRHKASKHSCYLSGPDNYSAVWVYGVDQLELDYVKSLITFYEACL